MKKRNALCCVLIALNLALIWGNSTLPGGVSMELSDGFLALLSQGLPALAVIGSILIRKLAHFSEFACLGLLLGWLLSPEGGFRGFAAPALLGTLAACVDETIQRFVPGRESSLIDVWIDIFGVCAGILLLRLGYRCIRRRKERKQNF
ncbi:MAG: VanZ family protein [Clostridiales bacterium]|nr:VanZ family protein [Clostridiales bacterium]MCI7574501.1 VanZ family protein [Clostridiales bacterium]